MLTIGFVLLALGLIVVAVVPRGREVGIVAAVLGAALVLLSFVPAIT